MDEGEDGRGRERRKRWVVTRLDLMGRCPSPAVACDVPVSVAVAVAVPAAAAAAADVVAVAAARVEMAWQAARKVQRVYDRAQLAIAPK